MSTPSEIWKEIKPRIGEMLVAVNDIETRAEKAQEEAYQRGLNDAWECARTIFCTSTGELERIFDLEEDDNGLLWVYHEYTASEAIERIRQYEQRQKEQEPITAEDVMRQYLDTFCKGRLCEGCPLNTPDYTCGRGRHFLTSCPVSNEEVRKAYAAVLAKMKEKNDNK